MLLSFDGKVYLAQAGATPAVAGESDEVETATKIANPAQADAAFFALLVKAEGMTNEYKKAPLLKSIIKQLPLSNVTSKNMEKMFLGPILSMIINLNNKKALTACLSAIFSTFKYGQSKAKSSFQIIKPAMLTALIEAAATFINIKNDEGTAAAILEDALTNLANAGVSGSNTSPYLRQILNKAKTLKSPTLKNELFATCYKKISLTIKQPADRENIFIAEGLGDTYQKLLKGQKLN